MTFRKNSSEAKVGQEGGEVNFDAYGKRALIRVLKRLRSRQVDDGYETYIDKIIPMMVHNLLPLRRCLNLLANRCDTVLWPYDRF
jgi:hypothetical protein